MSETPLGPPPVEQLSDLGWARVEREMWSRLDSDVPPTMTASPARRRWLWIAPVLAAAAIVLLVVYQTRPAPAVETTRDDDGLARIVAGAAPSTMSFGDIHLTVEAESAVIVNHDARKPSAIVERGATWFVVAPREARPPFSVLAGDATVQVIGTRFRVARAGERVEVEVDHGVVRVTFHGTEVLVGAHQSWSSEHADVVAKTDEKIAKTDKIEASPTPITTAERAKPAPIANLVIAESAVRPVAVAPHARPEPALPVPVVDDRVRFEQLGALEARDANAAITGYLELSKRPGDWAAVSLFAAGRLAADRHDARAETFLAAYLRRFPAGANATDARQLLARLKGDRP